MSDTKVLTTEEAKVLPEHGDEDGGMPGVVLVDRDDLLATTRALEKAEAELDSAMFARNRYANTIGLIESAVGFSGANPVEETIEHVRRLKAERDACAAELADRYDARQAVANAEAERDAALARVAELEKTLGDSAKSRDWPCLDCQPESKEKANIKTLVSELVTALDEIVKRWDADYEGLVHSDPIDAARAALAKAKEATP